MAHIQIRNVSPEAHRRFKELARKHGMSMSEYLRLELERIARLPTWEEMNDRIERRGRVKASVTGAELVREDRDSH